MASKQYPLEVRALIESGTHNTIQGYYSKGHHDAEMFFAQFEGMEIPEWVDFCVGPDDVQQVWVRTVPIGEDNGAVFVPAEPNSRGAFPVTELNFGNAQVRQAYLTLASR